MELYSFGVHNLIAASSVPDSVWVWSAVGIVMAALLGFAIGLIYERSAARNKFKKASRHFSSMLQSTIESIDRAQEACQLLERFQSLVFTGAQLEVLEKKKNSLGDSLTTLIDKQRDSQPVPQPMHTSKSESPFDWKAEWTEIPIDFDTEFPDREAFDENLSMMLQECCERQLSSSLLLVKFDSREQLSERYGKAVVTQLFRSMGQVLGQTSRPADFVGRHSDGVWAVLIPELGRVESQTLAEKLRLAVRGHRFISEERGHEVLVTGSFGFAISMPNDSPELILNRAITAVTRSQQMGRNQLFVHDGARLEYLTSQA